MNSSLYIQPQSYAKYNRGIIQVQVRFRDGIRELCCAYILTLLCVCVCVLHAVIDPEIDGIFDESCE